MEASASTHEHAPPDRAAASETAEQRDEGRRLALLFLGSVLSIYLVLGYAIYLLVAALT